MHGAEINEPNDPHDWVLRTNWWWLPTFTILFALFCCGVFFLINTGYPDVPSVAVMNSASFATAYTLVVLLSPGFAARHLIAAIVPQFLTPFLFSQIDSGYAAWLTAQLLTTTALFAVHRVVAIPRWRHDGFSGRVSQTFSIRALLLITLVAALAIVGFEWVGFEQDFFVIVASLCGPPLFGVTIASQLTRLRLARLYAVVVASGLLLVAIFVVDSKGLFQTGYGEVEPLAMLSGLLATMVVISLINIPFRNRNAATDTNFARATDIPRSAWVLRCLNSGFRDSNESQSRMFGLLGLMLLLVVVGAAFPFALQFVRGHIQRGAPSLLMTMLLIQTICFIPLTVFGIVAGVPMFCSGAILGRLFIGLIVAAPGVVALFIADAMQVDAPKIDGQLCEILFTFFAAVGYVAVGVQLWSRWTLTPLRLSRDPLPRAGINALFELTGICAVVYAISLSLKVSGIVEGVVFIGGPLGAIAAIGFLIGTLSKKPKVLLPTLVAFVIALVIAATVSGFFAYAQFGWLPRWRAGLIVFGAALYGASLIVCTMWICTLWLRACGWSCQTLPSHNSTN